MIWSLLITLTMFHSTEPLRISFALGESPEWRIVNDGVMGGLSKGYIEQKEHAIRFYGNVSLENNGGFTSFRSPYGSTDLSDFKTLKIKAKVEGQKIGFNMNMEEAFWLPYYRVRLEPKGGWYEYEFDMDEIQLHRMGESLYKPLKREDLENVVRMGFITASKKDSQFEFEVEFIEFTK